MNYQLTELHTIADMQNGQLFMSKEKSMTTEIVTGAYILGHDFTKPITGTRPPTIGEEQEIVSVDGRASEHSSVSGQSEVSTATPR